MFWIFLVALFAVSTNAEASQTLTLSLESPALDHPAQELSTKTSDPAPKPPVKSARDNTVKIGRVGLVQVSEAYIYKSKSHSSRRYATLKAETPLAVVKEEGEWYGVLMVNGSVGWIPRKNVHLTGYELLAKKQDINRGSVTSRGGNVDRGGALSEPIIRAALRYEGVRYVFGGNNPATGMDCSAYVRSVFSEFGVNLPRTAREQALVGEDVPFDQLRAGDRLYFSCKNPFVDHCGIYAGNGYFIHCASSRGGVAVDNLASSFYSRSLVTARRS